MHQMVHTRSVAQMTRALARGALSWLWTRPKEPLPCLRQYVSAVYEAWLGKLRLRPACDTRQCLYSVALAALPVLEHIFKNCALLLDAQKRPRRVRQPVRCSQRRTTGATHQRSFKRAQLECAFATS